MTNWRRKLVCSIAAAGTRKMRKAEGKARMRATCFPQTKRSVPETRKRAQSEPCLKGARRDDVDEQAEAEKSEAPVAAFFSRAQERVAVIPDQKKENERDEIAVFLVVFGLITEHGPFRDRQALVEREERVEIGEGGRERREEKGLERIFANPIQWFLSRRKCVGCAHRGRKK